MVQGVLRSGFGPYTAAEAQRKTLRTPVVDGSRIIAWAQRRASWVHKLTVTQGCDPGLDNFSAEELRRLVAIVGPSLEEVEIGRGLYDLSPRSFWKSLGDSVAPHGRLRSLVVKSVFADIDESDLEPLGQHLAGSLEKLVLTINDV